MTDSNESLERLSESTEPLERQINHYQAQLKHIDQLLERASKGVATSSEPAAIRAQVEQARKDRDKFSGHLDALKKMSPAAFSEKIMEKSGPMGMWDAVAGELEKLVERVERK